MSNERMQASPEADGNAVLGALPLAQSERLMRLCGTRPLSVDQVLGSRLNALKALVFPLTGLVVESFGDGEFGLVQLNLVGTEGMLGSLRPEARDAFHLRHTVIVGGHALVIDRRKVREALRVAPRLAGLVDRFNALHVGQLARAAICLGFHPAQSRLARWLLEASDRSGSGPIEITHERLAVLLGVRRSGVTVCAGRLSAAGLIDYRRGVIRIRDQTGLERAACSCFAQARSAHPRALHLSAAADTPPARGQR